jgi:hypothetical protein
MNLDWEVVTELQQTKLQFTIVSGLKKPESNVLDTLLFSDKDVADFIVQETNRYEDTVIQSCTLKPRSRVRNSQPLTGEDMCYTWHI